MNRRLRDNVGAILGFEDLEDRNGNELLDNLAVENKTAKTALRPKKSSISFDTELLLKDLAKLYLNPEYSDVVLVVEGEQIPVLRSLLACRNDYFRALFYGNLSENRNVIELADTPPQAFKHLLKYLYTATIDLNGLNVDTIIQMIQVSRKYCFPPSVIDVIDQKLRSMLSVNNVLKIYEETKLFSLESLSAACLRFIDLNAEAILRDESFYHYCSLPLLKEILLRDSFCADESEIFQAAHEWIRFNRGLLRDVDIDDIIDSVRLPVMVGLDQVVKNGYLDGHWDLAYNLSYRLRALELSDVNLISSQFNCSMLNGEPFEYRVSLDGLRGRNVKVHKGWGKFKTRESLILKLAKRSRINHVKMLLPARKSALANDGSEPLWLSHHPFKSYSYTIQVSVDNENWDTVVSSQSEPNIEGSALPVTWQIWYFKPVIANYVRILEGNNSNTESSWFYILSVECMFSSKAFVFDKSGVLIPNFDVASIPYVSDITVPSVTFRCDCDMEIKYKECFIARGNRNVTINLQQPCFVESLRFLLYDRDSKVYYFTVEVSSDGLESNFVEVSGISDSRQSSWQTIKFTPQVVKSIRINCGERTNPFLRIVHFECPAVEENST